MSPALKMWPDHETEIDLLGFQHLVSAVCGIVHNDELLPATIGVFGDWGSGKSSLMAMAGQELASDKDVCVLTFNGWLFEGYDDAKAVLMESIVDEVVRQRTLGSKAKHLALRLLKRVDWLRIIGGSVKHGALLAATTGADGLGAMAAVAATDAISKVRDGLADVSDDDVAAVLDDKAGSCVSQNIKKFREELEELLGEAKVSRLVVMIDDLDRCLPNTILDTLEAIRLFLYVPQTAFIIGADEKLVASAVRRRFQALPGDDRDLGRDYLEKLVQFPVRIPALGRVEFETYISMLFSTTAGLDEEQVETARKHVLNAEAGTSEISFNLEIAKELLGEIPEELTESLALGARLAPILAKGLNGNPRQCKRFLNMLVMRMAMAEERKVSLTQRVLAKLMVLEYLYPEYFGQLARWQAEQNGRPAQLVRLEAGEDTGEPREKQSGAQEVAPADDAGNHEVKTRAVRIVDPVSERELAIWEKDSRLQEWLALEPKLADEDLRPYFYFSRDTLGSVPTFSRRLSPQAQEVATMLLQGSDASRSAASRKAGGLSELDAAAVFGDLANRVRAEESLEGDGAVFPGLLALVEGRPELAGQLVALLESLPETAIPFPAPPRLKNVCSGTDGEAPLLALGRRWARSESNKRLAQTAANTFENEG